MLLLVSPSKTQKFAGPPVQGYTPPTFRPEIKTLVSHLKKIDRAGLARLMSLSEKLADATWHKFQNFSDSFSPQNSRPAIFTFQGDVYGGIRAAEFSPEELAFAQQHLRILSGLYGLLKPLDLFQPYRLEMKTRLQTPGAKDLYTFWGSKITELLQEELAGESHLVNLASREYFKAVQPQLLPRPVLDIVFKTMKNGVYKVIAIHAKRARGLMVNFVIRKRLVNIEALQDFQEEGYCYNASLSSAWQWVFCKG